jgi:hypothetical protein
MICFMQFVRVSIPYWLWRQVIPFTYFQLRAHGGCDQSAVDAYSFAASDPTSGFSRGLCKTDFHCGLFHLSDLGTALTVDFSLCLTWLTDFYCGLFRLPNLHSLHMTTNIWNGAHGGCDRSAEDSYSSVAPDPTFTFIGGPCCPTFEAVIAFWIMITFHIVNFTILYCVITCWWLTFYFMYILSICCICI